MLSNKTRNYCLLFSREGIHIFNLGSGKGTTVLEVIAAFSKASGKVIIFIAFYGVMGTLSHSKIILELLLQNGKPQAFS